MAEYLLRKAGCKDIRYSNEKEARGFIKCPKCTQQAKISCCADVGGVYIQCQCGFEEFH
jgi:hypothetical protein